MGLGWCTPNPTRTRRCFDSNGMERQHEAVSPRDVDPLPEGDDQARAGPIATAPRGCRCNAGVPLKQDVSDATSPTSSACSKSYEHIPQHRQTRRKLGKAVHTAVKQQVANRSLRLIVVQEAHSNSFSYVCGFLKLDICGDGAGHEFGKSLRSPRHDSAIHSNERQPQLRNVFRNFSISHVCSHLLQSRHVQFPFRGSICHDADGGPRCLRQCLYPRLH